ncbi:TonB-dependent siderophore receptor [Nostoc sp. CHAB 5844]|nr:TonB-dependent siderophore receptor [Nostoc sp. CHAB 5844]
MKPEQFVQSLLFTVLVAVLMAPAQGVEINQQSELREKRDSQLKQPSVLSQASSQQVVPVTGVQVNSTDQGVEIILQTPLGEQLQVKPKSEGNTYIAEISNAQLRLSSGDTFRQEKPGAGIAEITVTNQDANTILVTVKGDEITPQVELFDSDEGLIFGLTTTASVTQTPPAQQPETQPAPTPTPETEATPPAQQPESETSPQPPSAETDEPIELVVTGDRDDDYNALNATTGTRTDTPLRDIPQSIQVIPQKVIEDQQVIRLDEALNNVSNVIPGGLDTNTEARYTIRGFDNAPILINGFRQYAFPTVPETANLERIEVLKGPASILYGEIQPGGIINAVTKQPLAEPFYEIEVQAGNYNFVRPRIDLSGPLSDDKSLLYRLNFSYLNSETFRGFDQNFEEFFVAPVLAWKGKNTDFTFEAQYSNRRRPYDNGLLAFGNGVIDVPRDRIVNEPDDYIERTYISTGYSLEHRFSDKWTFRNGFRYANSRVYSDRLTIPTNFDESTGIVDRVYALDDFYSDDYSLQSNVVGKFATGGIKHTLLFGLDLNRTNSSSFATSNFFTPSQLDIFNPVYGATPRTALDVLLFDRESTTDRLGIYIQDEIAFFDNLKLLAGIRYETVNQQIQDQPALFYPAGTDTNQFNDAWTPRVGIVYQPLKEVSLYASYSKSFNPNVDSRNIDGDFIPPERGEGYEVGVKTELLDSKIFATLSYFDITKQNVATEDLRLPGLGFSVATGEQRSRGVEFDISGQILPGWNIIAAYAYTDAEVTADNTTPVGNRLVGVPRHSASLWTTYEIQRGNLQGLGFGVGFNYLGEREGDLSNSFQLDSYFLTNAAIFYRRDNWRFALNFKNVFDIDYLTGVSGRLGAIYPGEPFTVIGSVSVSF